MRRADRGFTLLEVLVAISILGIGLTAILSAQTGLFASSLYSERVSVAVGLARCRQSELEIKLAKMGYPLTDQTEEGVCCAEETPRPFTCKWKIEKILLPNPPQNTLGLGMGSPSSSAAATAAPSALSSAAPLTGAPTGLGPLSALAAIGATNGAVLGSNPALGDVSKMLAGSGTVGGGMMGSSMGGMGAPGGGFGSSGLATMVMSMVYPSLKPMLEASIRKVTVTVEWSEGTKTRNVEAVQYVTNPQQGGIDKNAANGLDATMDALGKQFGLQGSGTGTGTGTGTGAR